MFVHHLKSGLQYIIAKTNVKYWPSVTGSNIYKSRYRWIHVFRIRIYRRRRYFTIFIVIAIVKRCAMGAILNYLIYRYSIYTIPITLWKRILPRSGLGSVSPEMTSSKSMSLSPLRKSSSMLSMAVPAFLRWLLHQAVKVCKLKRELQN